MLTSELDRASNVHFPFSDQVRVMRNLRRGKRAKTGLLSGGHDICLPLTPMFRNTEITRGTIGTRAPGVLLVLGHRYIPQVDITIVGFDSIDVVDTLTRPGTRHVEPCQPVGLASSPKDANLTVACAVCASGDIPNLDLAASRYEPRKNASFWVVVQQLFERALCKFRIVVSHAVSPVKKWFGQRPARVDSTGGLRYFITHACSGAMGITKCLHQAALAAASVCMPANHRRTSNPFGALTPFNAL